MGTWTEQGFVAQSLSFYKERIQDIFLEAFGDDFILDDATEQGILITRIAELFYNADMDGVAGFGELNFNTISGIYLDIVGNLRGIPRSLGTPQTATVKITVNPNNFMSFTIPQGQQFSTVDGGEIFTAISGSLISTATATLQLQYSTSGNSTATIGAKMRTSGFSQITDIEITGLGNGTERESDAAYRARLRESDPVATNTIEYIENKLRALQLVKTVGHEYNDEGTTVDTIPPYCTEFMVVPISTADIETFKSEVGTVIVNNKVPGSPTFGNTTVNVTDIFGSPKTVSFTIPNAVNLQIEVQVGTPEASGFISLDEVPDIRTQIANYINGLGIGDDVSYSRCMAPLTADPNFDVLSFKIRERPVAPEWDSSKEYSAGDIVEYNGTFYIATETTSNPPTVGDWELYNVGWVVNQNFAIGKRQYATIDTANISIGV